MLRTRKSTIFYMEKGKYRIIESSNFNNIRPEKNNNNKPHTKNDLKEKYKEKTLMSTD